MSFNTESIAKIINTFSLLTKKPENFLSIQTTVPEEIKELTKKVYDLTKEIEKSGRYKDALQSLVIESFDEEQIWQEIELQNNCICDGIVADVAHVIAKQRNLHLPISSNSRGRRNDEDDNESDGLEKNDVGDIDDDKEDGIVLDEEGSGEEEEEEEEEVEDNNDFQSGNDSEDAEDKDRISPRMINKESKNQGKRSVVDDQFFKLSDMEQFLERMENNEGNDSKNIDKEEIDYFAGDVSESDSNDNETSLRYRYSDFFDAPHEEGVKKKRKSDSMESKASKKKKTSFGVEKDKKDKSVSFDLEEASSEESDEEKIKSSFEARQERVKARIETLEEDALGVKPWQMQGEVAGVSRPHNSLLEEYVDFDLASRPAPVITEQVTLRLEEVIERRIKDKAFDDVERKAKPTEEVAEYKKRLVLDQEKSKLSLAEIYEQQFIKQRDGAAPQNENPGDQVEEEPAAHVEITKMMRGLMVKLDALCNFHFTPKQVAPEVKIISNMPAIQMEEVAPVAMSEAMLLAPEEVKGKSKGDVKGKGERTVTDKKRERRQKKVRQRLRQKEREHREKLVAKLNPGLGNKYSREKAEKVLQKATKSGNITALPESSGKYVRSTKTFFSQLQDEVTSHIEKQATRKGAKKKTPKFSTKKLKL